MACGIVLSAKKTGWPQRLNNGDGSKIMRVSVSNLKLTATQMRTEYSFNNEILVYTLCIVLQKKNTVWMGV